QCALVASPQLIPSRTAQPEELVCPARRHASARRAFEKPYLDQERLVDVLDGIPFLAERRRQASELDRSTAELLEDRHQKAAIDFVEAVAIDFEHLQRPIRDLPRDPSGGTHLGVVANPPQQ